MPIKSTIWDLEEQTKAKHEILEEYLKAWFPILASHKKGLNYIDGFAGPGIYSKGEEGSPLIAMRTALGHKLFYKIAQTEIRFHFIEKDIERARKLKEVISEKFPNLPSNVKWYVYEGAEFENTLRRVLDELEKEKLDLAPSFVFIDPFGFDDFSLEIIKRILKYPACEVLITFMESFIKRFAKQNEKVLNRLFGTDKWREYIEKDAPLVDLFKDRLKEEAGAKYVWSFRIMKFGRTWYYLVFATNHIKGLEVMKEAMFKVDKRGTYTIGDIPSGQRTLLDSDMINKEVAEIVYKKFAGQTVGIEKIREFVIAETNYIFRKRILKELENQGKIANVKKDGKEVKRGTFPEGCEISFI